MTLSVHNLLNHYVNHPQAPELEKWEQTLSFISSIALAILTCGLVHLTVFATEKLQQQTPRNPLSPLPSIRNSHLERPNRDYVWLRPTQSSLSPENRHVNTPMHEDTFSRASFDTPTRLLLLDGDDGAVACRIHGSLTSGTIPKLSDHGRLESASRTLLRMNNLIAVRGGTPGASMIGPIDYLGNLEEPHRYLYTIQNGCPPVFYRKPIGNAALQEPAHLEPFDNTLVTTINANWISGQQTEMIEERRANYNVTPRQLRQSLFLHPGLLEVDRQQIELSYFDPRGIDLSSFKARLVENNTPFSITQRPLASKDDYRVVTYAYEPGYADWQVQHGSGLFLEKHDFSQTMTPVTPDSKGFVTLGRTNGQRNQLELIAIQIPYGYTLIVEEDCIHGDTTLNGLFMMGMTSDHTTMRTADTVFLKHPATRENVSMVITGQEQDAAPPEPNPIPAYVLYHNAPTNNRQEFDQMTRGQNFVFNPFSREYWNHLFPS